MRRSTRQPSMAARRPNGVWAIDLASDAKSGPPGRTQPVRWAARVGFNGTIYVAIGEGPVTGGGYSNAIVALDPKTSR
jgi:hypothetical protein